MATMATMATKPGEIQSIFVTGGAGISPPDWRVESAGRTIYKWALLELLPHSTSQNNCYY